MKWRTGGRSLVSGRRSRRSLPIRVVRSATAALNPRRVVAYWWRRLPNWGDALNPVLVRHLAGAEPLHSDEIFNVCRRPIYSAIGSVIGSIDSPDVVVWGSGLLHGDRRIRAAPRAVLAVRGPKTRERLLRSGIACPAVYGDPALLYPRFYRPLARPQHRLGLIPHLYDQDDPLVRQLAEHPGVKVIDVRSGVNEFVDGLLSCEVIASSSLHGLVAADAYGLPSVWLRISDRVEGSDFKFEDYFLGAETGTRRCVTPTTRTTVAALQDQAVLCRPGVDLDRLLGTCPFLARS
jgi:pyruvyltransferase